MKLRPAQLAAFGVACLVLGFLRFWTILKLAVSIPGMLGDPTLNLEAWFSFGMGVAGIALLGWAFVCATLTRKNGKDDET